MAYLYQTPLGKEIARRYDEERLTMDELAREYNVSRNAIRKCILTYSKPRSQGRWSRWSMPDQTRRAAAELYMSGNLTLKEVAEKFKCSETTIHNAVVEFYGHDFKSKMASPRKRGRHNSEARVLDLYHSGVTDPDEIATRLRILPVTVRKHLRANGLLAKPCALCGSPIPETRFKYCSNACADISSKLNKRLREHGLTTEEFQSLFVKQGGRCAICQEPHDNLVIDHDHTTGQVRGLLCNACNVALGMFRDNIGYMHNAISYLSVS